MLMVVMKVVRRVMSNSGRHREQGSDAGKLAAEHGLAGVDLAAAGAGRAGLARLRRTPEHGERAEILGVAAVGHARDWIVVPVQEAGLDGGFKSAEDLDVGELAGFVGGILVVVVGVVVVVRGVVSVVGVAAAVVCLVRLNLEKKNYLKK
jgi:hypothetical protein